jgi:hypothetical protein
MNATKDKPIRVRDALFFTVRLRHIVGDQNIKLTIDDRVGNRWRAGIHKSARRDVAR